MGGISTPNLSKDAGLIPCAFLTQSIGTSQEGLFLTYEMNNLLKTYPNLNISVFYEDFDRIPTLPQFPMFPSLFLWGFKGIVITTDITSAYRIRDIPIKKKFLYVLNLEWLYHNKSYTYYNNIYNSDDFELIARSDEHANIIQSCWRKPSYVINDFDAKEIYGLIREQSEALRYS